MANGAVEAVKGGVVAGHQGPEEEKDHQVLRPRPGYDRLMHYGGYSFPSGH